VILGADWVVPVAGEPIRDGRVEISDGRIKALGEGGPADRSFPGCVIMPGLVDAHTHLEYAGMSGFGDGEPFDRWIADHIRRREGLTREDYRAQADLGAQACVAGGITTIADCCYAGTVGDAAEHAGLRAIVYLEAFSRHEPFDTPLRERLSWVTPSDLVGAGISPHAPYTVDLADYRLWIALARDHGLPVATHLLESHLDTEPAGYFRDVLGPDTVAIHAVRASADDIAVLAELDVPVVHCPRSNALLGCGTAPLTEMLDAGLRVGLGTDSPASALDFDMWEEMRAAILLARARAGRPDALTAAGVLELATAGGGRALGLDGVGTLTPGGQADLLVLDLRDTPFLPWDDPVTAAVYGGSPNRVVMTFVGGQLRYDVSGDPADLPDARSVRARMIEA
jgi:5-methylthioadenosine/S-adenosylhomocysteine deaminase